MTHLFFRADTRSSHIEGCQNVEKKRRQSARKKEDNTGLPLATTRKSGDFELQDAGLLYRFDFYFNIAGSYKMKC